MDAKKFWEIVDIELKAQWLTVSDLAHMIGVSRDTIYTQRKRNQLPKFEQMQSMIKVLGPIIMDTNRNNKFNEYLYYLERAEDWQLKAIREILKMPAEEKKSASDSINQVG